MAVTIDDAIDALRKLSPERQDEIAGYIKSIAENEHAEEIEPDHLADVLEGLAQLNRGERASDDAVASAFRRFRGE
jgi:Mg/Co/Ni transporter MgtE